MTKLAIISSKAALESYGTGTLNRTAQLEHEATSARQDELHRFHVPIS